MSNRTNILNSEDNPHKVSLWYTTTKNFATITLDLSKTDFELTDKDKQALAELPLKRDKCYFTNKKAVLVTLRDTLLEVLEPLMTILAKHVSVKNES